MGQILSCECTQKMNFSAKSFLTGCIPKQEVQVIQETEALHEPKTDDTLRPRATCELRKRRTTLKNSQIQINALTDTNNIAVYSSLPSTRSNSTSSDRPKLKSKLSGRRLSISNFELLRVEGSGYFGKVFLARRKGGNSGELLAIKIIKKKGILENNTADKLKLEKRVLKENKCPFIASLKYSFQDQQYLYLVMRYYSGGSLRDVLIKEGKLPLKRAVKIAAELVLALEYLHKNLRVVHRDLKPENILIDDDGYIKLIDFGLSKTYEGNSFTTVGTKYYIAPEILKNEPHSHLVDFWSLGVVIYELLVGMPPFDGKNEHEIPKKIIENQPVYPSSLKKEAVDLLKSLLKKAPAERLADFEIIKKSAFFEGIDWKMIWEKKSPLKEKIAKVSLNFRASSQILLSPADEEITQHFSDFSFNDSDSDVQKKSR